MSISRESRKAGRSIDHTRVSLSVIVVVRQLNVRALQQCASEREACADADYPDSGSGPGLNRRLAPRLLLTSTRARASSPSPTDPSLSHTCASPLSPLSGLYLSQHANPRLVLMFFLTLSSSLFLSSYLYIYLLSPNSHEYYLWEWWDAKIFLK